MADTRAAETPPAAGPGGEDLLWFIAEGTAGAVGETFFQRLVQRIAQAFAADVAFVAELVPEDRSRARFLARWEGSGLVPPREYRLAETPCAEVRSSAVVSFPEGVMARFPDDAMVARLRLESYLAVALHGADGEHLGHLGVLATVPLRPGEHQLAALRIFAARAAVELERRRGERALREREAAHRSLAEEQAALRRVAMLVAAGAPQQEVLDRVVAEAGPLLDADITSLVRAEHGAGQIVAGWSRSAAPPVAVGRVFDLEATPLTIRVLRSGRPLRADEPELRDQHAFTSDIGVRSAAVAPIDVAGRRWGVVRAASTGTVPLPPGAETRLGAFAELAAQAVANAEARAELSASRARIVEAGDAARRRIERNLHDGAQQRLVALSLWTRLAARELRDDPRAAERLEHISGELAAALQELRALARGIHPAVLTDHGLVAALEALAARAAAPVELRLAVDGRLAPAIEATAYYIVAEALTNVAKYADARSAEVTVEQTERALVVRITDDGAGGADLASGSGLRGLADRAEALRGTLTVRSEPGRGTEVTARLPLST
ncbi:MAG TPA: GAF domain-containing protein [Solirubrobacteraceae bacterium]|nr:GAF domain-containing protein [Solirubrobacteraceae bacterium]